jgi:dolichol-phosphate mannosyltransferase
MTSARLLLSIVCPAYQEEHALPHFHRELMKVVEGLTEEFDVEIVYSDDGSRDGTLAILRQFAQADQRVRFVSLSRNFGQQAALTAGLEHAQGDLVVMMDSDLQHPPELIPELLAKWREGAEVVITIRAEDPTVSWLKRFTSRAFYRMMHYVSRTEIRAAASDFRLMTRTAIQGLLQMGESQRFIRGMVQWLGFPCAQVVFSTPPRIAGQSKYTFRSMLKLALDGMFSFSRLPLRLSLFLGLLLVIIGFGCGSFLTLQMIRGVPTDTNFWLLMSAMHLIGGSVLLALGVVGEYVGRIYEQVKRRPVYVLKETGNLTPERTLKLTRRAV